MAGLLSPTTLEQVRVASDIVDVIGAALPLKRAGANFVTLCPFHREKTPSFNVNPHRQIFHCFGCHKGGDVFTFIQEYENITFIEAVRRLAERANIALEFESGPGQQQARYLKETLLQIHEQITQRWHSALLNDAAGQIARDYLHRRGVPDEAVKLFRLGYAPDLWDDTVNWARRKEYEPALVEQAGLIIRKEDGGHYYDRFRGRLIFPICDEQSRVIGFSGRILSGEEKSAKYVNSPETPIFTKGKVFFGLDKSKRAILDAACAIICEGQLDLIACYMAGIQNVVAPQGTAFTPEHARILKRYVDEVVLCFDSDTAGQAAAVRVLDSLLASGLAIRVMTIPAPHDPDSFIKEKGGMAFQQLIARAEGFFDFYLTHLCTTNDVATDKGRISVARSMAEAVLKTGSAILADTYAQKTAQRLGVSMESVRTEFKKPRYSKVSPSTENEVEPAPTTVKLPQEEYELLLLLLTREEYVPWVSMHLNLDWLNNPTIRRIVDRLLQSHSEGRWQNAASFLLEFRDDSDAQSLLTAAMTAERESRGGEFSRSLIRFPEKQLAAAMLNLRNDFINRKLAALTLRLNQPDVSESEKIEILNQQGDLRRCKKESFPKVEPC